MYCLLNDIVTWKVKNPENPTPPSLCQPQVSHSLIRDRTQVLRGERLEWLESICLSNGMTCLNEISKIL